MTGAAAGFATARAGLVGHTEDPPTAVNVGGEVGGIDAFVPTSPPPT